MEGSADTSRDPIQSLFGPVVARERLG